MGPTLPTRRFFLAGLTAIALCGCPRRSPLSTLATPLQGRLQTFAALIEAHRWDDVLSFFDREHMGFQHRLWFSPDYNDAPPNPADPAENARFEEWYLIETLGLGYVDNHIDSLTQIIRVEWDGVEEPFGLEGPLEIRMKVQTTLGPRTGWFFVDRQTGLFFGSVG